MSNHYERMELARLQKENKELKQAVRNLTQRKLNPEDWRNPVYRTQLQCVDGEGMILWGQSGQTYKLKKGDTLNFEMTLYR